MPYRDKFNQLIKDVEGVREDAYTDTVGKPTVGVGFNLEDPDVRGIMSLGGIDPDAVARGERSLAPDEISQIKQSYFQKREPMIRNQVGGDLYDNLDDNKKASILSMGYQSLNNIGPNLRKHIAGDDNIGAIREIVLNTNKMKDPGIQTRRLKEAEMFGGEQFPQAFETFSDEEKKQVLDILSQIQNEHTKKEMLDKYNQFLTAPQPNRFDLLDSLRFKFNK